MARTRKEAQTPARVPTSITGLDEIILGGLMPVNSYLVRGGPGTGKTILGLHYLAAGAAAGEKVVYISLSESTKDIQKNALALGFDLKGIDFLDLAPTAEFFSEDQSYDIFSPVEVERDPITKKIIDEIGKLKPTRVFLDAVTQFRFLSTDEFEFRRQVLSFLSYMAERGITVLMASEASAINPDDDLQFMVDGVINLGVAVKGRVISITKFRGSDYRSGEHSVAITDKGIAVFPRLIPSTYGREYTYETISSGVAELDELLNGGIERGTVSLITGPSGVGKTTLGLQFMKEAAGRGERSVIYTFEEDIETLVQRAESVNIPVRSMIERGTLAVVPIEPLRYSPDEFAAIVRHEVEEKDSSIVMIDSTAGYKLTVRGEDLVANLHALTKYLKNMGITVILINEVEFITGDFRLTELGISYLADNVIVLRYLEMFGELRKAIGVLKKRVSNFERTLRELEITRYGIKIGKPLTGLRGILVGNPEWVNPPAREDQ
ncbi:MAG: ATPase domain-containing protein [Candidatus Aquicultor sp.]